MIKKGTVVLVYHEKYGVVVGIKNDSYKIRMFGEWGSRLEHYIDHCDVWDVREI